MTGQRSYQEMYLTAAVNIRDALSNTVRIKTSLCYQFACRDPTGENWVVLSQRMR